MKYLSKTIEYGLYLLVFLLPLETRWIIKAGRLNGGYWEYGTYSLYGTDILLIFVLLLFIIYKFLERRITNYELRITNLIQNLMISGLILASAVSAVFALDKPLALYKFGWLILGVGLFWLAAGSIYSRVKLIYAVSAGAFLQAGLGIWQFLTQSSFASKWLGLAWHDGADLGTAVVEAVGAGGLTERWLRAYGGLDHPNVLGGVLAIIIIIVIGQILVQEKSFGITNYELRITDKIKKAILWLFLVLLTAGLFFSFSRSAWLALAAGLAALIVWAAAAGNYKAQRDLAETVLVMGIIIFIFFSQYENLITARLGGEGRLEAKSNSERLASYQEAWQVIKNNWLLGVGPGNYTLAVRDKIFPSQAGYYYQPAHNSFILVWAETGILGIIFFVGLIIFSLVGWLHGRSNNLAILIALIIIMSFDHWLWSLHFGVLFFWLAVGLTAGGKYMKN